MTFESPPSHGLDSILTSAASMAGPTAPTATAGSKPVRRQFSIMVVDDEPLNIRVLQKYLAEIGFRNVTAISDPREALSTARRLLPDLIILDLVMPEVNGREVLRDLKATPNLNSIPVIVLTASNDRATRVAVLEDGAADFLGKPIDPSELAPRVRNMLAIKQYQDELLLRSQSLEEMVRLRTVELEASRRDVIFCLARAAEFRDDDTGQHVIRVGRYAAIVAEGMGFSPDAVAMLQQAAQLHDVGKIGIPDAILLKPGKLTPEEFDLMQKHALFGKRIVDRAPEEHQSLIRRHAELGSSILNVSQAPVMQMAARIALTHHEWWDGTGYPLGLAGTDIPLEGRITSVADVFDALSSRRPYKNPFPLEKCLGIIQSERGTHFDPQVVDAFMARREEIVAAQIELADSE
jgi:putative two-component system response regulator